MSEKLQSASSAGQRSSERDEMSHPPAEAAAPAKMNDLSPLPKEVVMLIGRFLTRYYLAVPEDGASTVLRTNAVRNDYVLLSLCNRELQRIYRDDEEYWLLRYRYLTGRDEPLLSYESQRRLTGLAFPVLEGVLWSLYPHVDDLLQKYAILRLPSHVNRGMSWWDSGYAKFPSKVLEKLLSLDVQSAEMLRSVVTLIPLILLKVPASFTEKSLALLERLVELIAKMPLDEERLIPIVMGGLVVHDVSPQKAILASICQILDSDTSSFALLLCVLSTGYKNIQNIVFSLMTKEALDLFPEKEAAQLATLGMKTLTRIVTSHSPEDLLRIAIETKRLDSWAKPSVSDLGKPPLGCSCSQPNCCCDEWPRVHLYARYLLWKCAQRFFITGAMDFSVDEPPEREDTASYLLRHLFDDQYFSMKELSTIPLDDPHLITCDLLLQIARSITTEKMMSFLEDCFSAEEIYYHAKLCFRVIEQVYNRCRNQTGECMLMKQWKIKKLTARMMNNIFSEKSDAPARITTLGRVALDIDSLRLLLKLSSEEFMSEIYDIVCYSSSPSPLSRLTFPPFFCMEEPSARRHLLLLFQDMLNTVDGGMVSGRSDDRRQACQAFERCLVDMLVIPLRSAGPPEWEIPFWKGSLEEEKTSRIYRDSYRAVLKLKVLLHDKGLVTHCNCESKPLDASGGSYLRCSICDVLSPASPNVVETAQSVLSPSELELLCHDMCKDCALKANERGQESKPSVRSSKRGRQ